MSVHPLDLLIRTYVQPVMRASGFRRRSRTFVRELSDGDQVALFVSPGLRLGDGYFRFYITPGLAPRPFVDWMSRNRPSNAKASSLPAVTIRMATLPPPVEFYGGAIPLDRPDVTTAIDAAWKVSFYSDEQLAGCGSALAAAIESDLLPHLNHLQVRENLLRQVLSPQSGSYQVYAPRPEVTEVILLVDDAPPAHVHALIRSLESDPDNREFVQWSRARLARRRAEPNGS